MLSRCAACVNALLSVKSAERGPLHLPSKKLLARVPDAIRLKHHACSREHTSALWINRFILFSDKQHPKDTVRTEI